MIFIVNKCDLSSFGHHELTKNAVDGKPTLFTSFSNPTIKGLANRSDILKEISLSIQSQSSSSDIPLFASTMRLQQLATLRHALEEVEGNNLESIALSLKAARLALDDLAGLTTSDDVLGAVFAKMCVGK